MNRGSIRAHKTGFFHDLNNPKRLGLFFCIRTRQELDQIRQLLTRLTREKKSGEAIVFYRGSGSLDVITHKAIFMFNLDDFSLFGKMKEPLQEKFSKERFDLLISFTFDPDLFCKRLVSEMNADFKIGPDHVDGELLYDMMIGQEKNKTGIIGFYEEVVRYLGMLNVKNG